MLSHLAFGDISLFCRGFLISFSKKVLPWCMRPSAPLLLIDLGFHLSFLSVSLPHSCPDPRECPFQKLPCPLQCPSLPPAQESAVTAAKPLVNTGLTPDCRPGPHTPSCALSCLGSPSSLLPSGHPPSPAPHRPRGLPTAPPLPTCSQSLQAGVSSSPSHGSSAPLPSRSHGPAD